MSPGEYRQVSQDPLQQVRWHNVPERLSWSSLTNKKETMCTTQSMEDVSWSAWLSLGDRMVHILSSGHYHVIHISCDCDWSSGGPVSHFCPCLNAVCSPVAVQALVTQSSKCFCLHPSSVVKHTYRLSLLLYCNQWWDTHTNSCSWVHQYFHTCMQASTSSSNLGSTTTLSETRLSTGFRMNAFHLNLLSKWSHCCSHAVLYGSYYENLVRRRAGAMIDAMQVHPPSSTSSKTQLLQMQRLLKVFVKMRSLILLWLWGEGGSSIQGWHRSIFNMSTHF